jgi:hypothetical protein
VNLWENVELCQKVYRFYFLNRSNCFQHLLEGMQAAGPTWALPFGPGSFLVPAYAGRFGKLLRGTRGVRRMAFCGMVSQSLLYTDCHFCKTIWHIDKQIRHFTCKSLRV